MLVSVRLGQIRVSQGRLGFFFILGRTVLRQKILEPFDIYEYFLRNVIYQPLFGQFSIVFGSSPRQPGSVVYGGFYTFVVFAVIFTLESSNEIIGFMRRKYRSHLYKVNIFMFNNISNATPIHLHRVTTAVTAVCTSSHRRFS